MLPDHPSDRPHRKRVRHYDEPGHVHELTFSCYQRLPLLTDDVICRLFCEALDRAIDRHGYDLLAFVVMPEHVHLLVHPRLTGSTVSELLFAIKRPSSFRIKAYLERTTPLNSNASPSISGPESRHFDSGRKARVTTAT